MSKAKKPAAKPAAQKKPTSKPSSKPKAKPAPAPEAAHAALVENKAAEAAHVDNSVKFHGIKDGSL